MRRYRVYALRPTHADGISRSCIDLDDLDTLKAERAASGRARMAEVVLVGTSSLRSKNEVSCRAVNNTGLHQIPD